MLVVFAAIPLLQVGACGAFAGQTTLALSKTLGGDIVDSIGNATLNLVFNLLGGAQSLFGSASAIGSGFSGFGGGFGS